MYPTSLFSQKLSVSELPQSSLALGKHVHSKQMKANPTQLQQFMSGLCAYPASLACIQHIFSTHVLLWSNIRSRLGTEKAEKLAKIYWFFRAKQDIQCNVLKLFELIFCCFKPLKFHSCAFCLIQKNIQVTVQMWYLFYFTLHCRFSKGKVECCFWWVSSFF